MARQQWALLVARQGGEDVQGFIEIVGGIGLTILINVDSIATD